MSWEDLKTSKGNLEKTPGSPAAESFDGASRDLRGLNLILGGSPRESATYVGDGIRNVCSKDWGDDPVSKVPTVPTQEP